MFYQRGIWLNRDFLRLWLGETVSLFGSYITEFALPLVAVISLGASPLEMGLLSATGVMPILVLGLPAGAWLDRRSRRPVLIATNLGRALLLSCIPLAAYFNSLTMPLLYLIALGTGALSVLFDIAYQAYFPSLVEDKHLVDGNGKLGLSQSVAQIAGPAAGGLLVTLLTAPFTILLDAISFLFSALCLIFIRRPELAPQESTQQKHTFRGDILEGLQFIRRHTLLRTIVIGTGLINIGSGAIFAQQLLYMTRTLGLTPAIVGIILSIGGPSAMLGAVFVSRISQRQGVGRTILVGAMLFTLGDFFLALAGGPELLIIGLLAASQFCIGVGSPIYNVTVISLRQRLAPNHLIGRITASARLVTIGTLPLGALLGGTLAEVIGLHPTLLIAAGWVLVSIAWLARSPLGMLTEQPLQAEGSPGV